MIGLILLFFAGKAYYDLAGRHGKSQWGFAILGVVSYYAGLFFGGIGIAIAYETLSPGSFESTNDVLLGLMAVPVGILFCWGLYRILESNWSKTPKRELPGEILDAELPGRENA